MKIAYVVKYVADMDAAVAFHRDRLGLPLRFASPRKPGTRRGTGCTLATAIAAHLALGEDLAKACDHAKRYLSAWW